MLFTVLGELQLGMTIGWLAPQKRHNKLEACDHDFPAYEPVKPQLQCQVVQYCTVLVITKTTYPNYLHVFQRHAHRGNKSLHLM